MRGDLIERQIEQAIKQWAFGREDAGDARAADVFQLVTNRSDLLAEAVAAAVAPTIAELQAQLAEMRAAADDVNHERDAALGEVARLRERLEIGFYYKPSPDGDVFVKVADEEGITESYDGIACRDETIRLLDALVARAKVRLSDMREALETLITAVEWEVPAIRDGVDAERRLGILARHAREARASLSHKQEDAA